VIERALLLDRSIKPHQAALEALHRGGFSLDGKRWILQPLNAARLYVTSLVSTLIFNVSYVLWMRS
jgi:hypothetical protein